ncbi:MAG: LLM class F420-dependent oxidoreductase [Acidimicrobiaceae bacterium]|nr:LLM class F420-dependent oxidoreductase [Acidimicrobiaceae bacterium]
MRISMQLNYAGDFHSSLSQILEYEREGLDILWVAEAYGLDSPTLMGYLAAKTTSLQIGSAILPIFTRTPALIAQTAAGLDEVSQGRALLGLGASGPQVIEGWHGVRYDKPLQRTREIVEVCRKVWSREYLQNDGIYQIPLPLNLGTGLGKPLKLITHPIRSRIPIYIASLGPKNVEMIAEIAEGWLPIFFIPERAREVWGAAIAAGLNKRSNELGKLDIVAGGMLAIGENLDHLLELARSTTALYIGGLRNS